MNTVKLHTSNKKALLQRIELNSGVTPVVQPNTGRQYEDNTFIPKNDWYQPSNDILDRLICDTPLFKSNTIKLLPLPEPLISLLNDSGIMAMTSTDEQQAIFQQNRIQIKALFKELMRFTNNLMLDPDTQDHLGFLSAPMGQQTTAVNGHTQLYAGLHIDSYDQKLLDDAKHARQRMTIHLGKEKRYLLFINLSVDQLREKLLEVGIMADNSFGQTKLVYEFLKRFPDTPLIKLEQRPYEAYIAPTENIIHDGITLASNFLDLTWTTVGDFGKVDFNSQL